MTVIVQNDDGTVVDANAYVDLNYFQMYCEERGLDLSSYDEAQCNSIIIVSTAYIDNDKWKGELVSVTQTTEFPRDCLYDKNFRLVTGIFRQLKQATCEYGYQGLLNGGVLELSPPQIGSNGLIAVSETKKLGPLEKTTSYMEGSQYTRRPYPTAERLLAQFRKSSGQRVIR